MGRHSFLRSGLVICAVWVLLATACSGDDAAPSTTTGAAATTIPATTTSTTAAATTMPSATTTEPPPAVEKPYGGAARILMWEVSLDTLNPFTGSTISEPYSVGMWRMDWDTREMVPDLVTQLPTFANGGLVDNGDGTVTVHLEIVPEAAWEDGVPISGEDFAFTYELHTTYGLEGPAHLVDPESLVAGPKSFEFTLTAPQPGWEQLFSVIVPKHDVEGSDFFADWNDRIWVSGGPFRFESHEGDHVVFARNPNYWRYDPETGRQLPYLDRLEVGWFFGEHEETVLAMAPPELRDAVQAYFAEDYGDITDEQFEAIDAMMSRAAVDGLVEGRFDAGNLVFGPPAEIAGMLESLEDEEGVAGEWLQTYQWELLGFNFGPGRLDVNDGSWNEHLDFRRAVAHALDRDRIVSAALGIPWPRLDSYLQLYSPSLSSGAWSRYPYDPDRARELLAGLCDEQGRNCEADPPRLVLHRNPWIGHRDYAADEIAAQLGAVGIDVVIEDIGPFPVCGDYDVVEFMWITEPTWANLIGTHEAFDPAQPPTPTVLGNIYRWGTPAVEGLADDPNTDWVDESCLDSGPSAVIDEHTERMAEILERLGGALDPNDDPEMLRSLVAEAEEIAADQLVFIPLFVVPRAVMWRDDLAGFGVGAYNLNLLWDCEEWYRTNR